MRKGATEWGRAPVRKEPFALAAAECQGAAIARQYNGGAGGRAGGGGKSCSSDVAAIVYKSLCRVIILLRPIYIINIS